MQFDDDFIWSEDFQRFADKVCIGILVFAVLYFSGHFIAFLLRGGLQ